MSLRYLPWEQCWVTVWTGQQNSCRERNLSRSARPRAVLPSDIELTGLFFGFCAEMQFQRGLVGRRSKAFGGIAIFFPLFFVTFVTLPSGKIVFRDFAELSAFRDFGLWAWEGKFEKKQRVLPLFFGYTKNKGYYYLCFFGRFFENIFSFQKFITEILK